MDRAMHINNFYIALYELFGICGSKIKDPATLNSSQCVVSSTVTDLFPAAMEELWQQTADSAKGTVLRINGDIDLTGGFCGDIFCRGAAILHSVVEGSVTAMRLQLAGCTLTGDISVADVVVIDEQSKVCGNISAREVICAGEVEGYLAASETAALESTACVHGDVDAGNISMARGAVLRGSVWVARELKD